MLICVEVVYQNLGLFYDLVLTIGFPNLIQKVSIINRRILITVILGLL